MPPLPLDERIVVIQRPKTLALCESSPQSVPQHSSHISASANGQIAHSSQFHPPQSNFYSSACKSLSLECKRRGSRVQKFPGNQSVVPAGVRHTPSHCHSNGTVTLPSHTHTIDIRVTLDKGGRGPGHSNSLRGSAKGSRGKCVASQVDQEQCNRKLQVPTGRSDGAERLQRSHQRQLSLSPGGGLQFVPAQSQTKFRGEKESSAYQIRNNQEYSSLGHKKSSKLGTVHQSHNTHSLPYQHSSVPVPHASILNSNFTPSPPSQPPPAPAPNPFQQLSQPRPSRPRDPRSHLLHGLPLSPCSSHNGTFPSPDHTCTIDCTHPFSCGCWRLLRCRGCKGRSSSCQGGGGSTSTSFSCVHNVAAVKQGSKDMKHLTGCLSTASTTNTSSSNSTVSDCRGKMFKPCPSCSGEASTYESPAILRKRLVGGCLPCNPLSSSGPIRALQSCVTGCNPKTSQTGSSTCSYCSSDPIVVTYNPRRAKPPAARAIGGAQPMGMYDDDDYNVRNIWPEELAKKMAHSKSQNLRPGIGMGNACPNQSQNITNATSLLLDCQNLPEYGHGTDYTGRRRFQQGKMSATFDFKSYRSGYNDGHNSLNRLITKEDTGLREHFDNDQDTAYPCPPPRPNSPPSPVSFSPPPSAPSTLIKPKPRPRDGGHSLPSAQSLHLALNSFNRGLDEENSRSLSDESVMTPDAENAVISPILPFLYLGNERDAQDLDLLLRLNIGFVVNVTTHLPLYHQKAGLRYKRLPATDNSKQNLRQYFEEVFEFIEAYQSGQGVLVHCQAGVSRSATVVIAYLMKHTLMTMTDAYKYVRSRRPVVSPNLNFMGQLLEFERDLNSGVTPRILMPKLNGVETQV
uniref:protein-tyrosine-phosphatase n=1 Tax=Periophthalmus magnuspinnatus TaxID=409849 RepID=A0A3B4A729_9GOBI